MKQSQPMKGSNLPKGRGPAATPQVRSPKELAEEIAEHSGILARATRQAAKALGLFEGANAAVKAARKLDARFDHPVMDYADEAVWMAAIRITALFENSNNNITFQWINRTISDDAVVEELCAIAASHNVEAREAKRIIRKYVKTYREVDWTSYGGLKSLRNLTLAHVTRSSPNRSLTFRQLRTLMNLACKLSWCLEIVTRGYNSRANHWVADWNNRAYNFWADLHRADGKAELPQRCLK
jgi:hypothetical protein